MNIAIPVDFYYLQSSAIDQVRDKLSNQEFKDTCEKDDSEKKAKCLKYVSSTFCKVFQSCYLYFEFIKILNWSLFTALHNESCTKNYVYAYLGHFWPPFPYMTKPNVQILPTCAM